MEVTKSKYTNCPNAGSQIRVLCHALHTLGRRAVCSTEKHSDPRDTWVPDECRAAA